jgi:drug/metabolite transporter (DMT)-like permease
MSGKVIANVNGGIANHMSFDDTITDEILLSRIQVLAGAFIISFSSIFVKLAHVGPTTAGFYRMLFGSLALLAAVSIKRHRLWIGWRATSAAGMAGLMFFLGLVFWHHSIHFIGPGLSTIFANHQVFVVAFGAAIFMGERPGRRLTLSIPLAVIGLFLIVAPEWSRVGPDYKFGVYLGLAAAIWYGSFLIIMRQSGGLNPALSPVANITVASIFSTFFMALEVLRRNEGFIIPDGSTWSALLVLGLGCHAVGWWLIIHGMPKIPLSAVGLSILLQPTGAFVWDILFFGRPTSIVEVAGATLALGAIYLGSTSRREVSRGT